MQKNIYFIKQLFNDVLPLVLRTKHRLNFGLIDVDNDNEYNYVAIPFNGLDIPSYNEKTGSASEFTSYNVKIIFTYMAYTATNSNLFTKKHISKLLDYIKKMYVIEIQQIGYKYSDIKPNILFLYNDLLKLYGITENINVLKINVNMFKKKLLLNMLNLGK